MNKSLILMIALLLPLPALADRYDAKACADDLSPSARTVYQNSLQAMQNGQEPRVAVGSQVKALVANGTLSQDNARGVTEAAVQCLLRFKS